MPATLHVASRSPFNIAASTTWYTAGAITGLATDTVEAVDQHTARVAGTFSGLHAKVITNDRAQSTFRFRVNGANGNQSLTIPASTTGEFSDLVNTDAVVDGDEFNYQMVSGAGGTTLDLSVLSVLFGSAGAYTVYRTITVTVTGSGTVSYATPGGGQGNATETLKQLKFKSAGTAKNLFAYVETNSRSTTSTIRLRKNAANGNGVLSIGAGTTGYFEDTSNTDSIAVDDLVNFSSTVGTGSGTFGAGIGIGFEATNQQQVSGTGPITVTTSQTRYGPIAGRVTDISTEANIASDLTVPTVLSYLAIYVGTNTITASSTFRLRRNSANGNSVVTIAASTTGWFEDASNTDELAATDDVNFSLVTGGTGTSLIYHTVSSLLTSVAAFQRSLNINQAVNRASTF